MQKNLLDGIMDDLNNAISESGNSNNHNKKSLNTIIKPIPRGNGVIIK